MARKRISTIICIFLSIAASMARAEGICDRNPDVQKAILAQLAGVGCDKVTQNQLSGIKELRIYYPDPFLKPTDLSGLTNLKTLWIWIYWKTEPGTFGADFFSGTPNLEELVFRDGSALNISKDTFRGLTKLRNLETTSAQITSPPADLFSLLTNIESIKLRVIDGITDGLFDNLPRLQTIEVQCGNHCTLPSNILEKVRRDAKATFWCFDNIPSFFYDPISGCGQVYLNTQAPMITGGADATNKKCSLVPGLMDEAIENAKSSLPGPVKACEWVGGTATPILKNASCSNDYVGAHAEADFDVNCTRK